MQELSEARKRLPMVAAVVLAVLVAWCALAFPQAALADASGIAYSRSVSAIKAYAAKDYSHATYSTSSAGSTVITVDVSDLNLTKSQRQAVQDRIFYNTDYWYVTISEGDNTSGKLTYRFMYTDKSIPIRQKELNAAVAKAKAWVANCKSQANKVHMLHDWLIKNVSYDYNQDNYPYYKMPYRCLVQKKADCNGYTYGMDYLLRACGFTTALALNDKADHAWNMVKVDGKWYHVDVTWGKSFTNKSYWKGCTCHRWLLLDDDAMKMDEHKGWYTVYKGVRQSVKATSDKYDYLTIQEWNSKCRKAVSEGTTFSSGGLKYKVTSKGSSVKVTAASSKTKTSYSVPSEVWYRGYSYKVTKVDSQAFKGCYKAKSLTVGSNVKTIGKSAFSGCGKLRTLTVKSAKLTKGSVKRSLKGSKVTTVKLSGSATTKKSAYKKAFAKSNSGRTVKVR